MRLVGLVANFRMLIFQIWICKVNFEGEEFMPRHGTNDLINENTCVFIFCIENTCVFIFFVSCRHGD